MGEHGSDHPGMLKSRAGCAVFRRRGRIAQGIYGASLEIRRLPAGARHDLWLADYQPIHLVDDRPPDLAGESYVCGLRHRD